MSAETINVLAAGMLLVAAVMLFVFTRRDQKQIARIAELTRERDEAIAKHVDIFHEGWTACEEHQLATQLVKRAHDAAMVELLGVVSDHDAARQSGELTQAVKDLV